MIKKLAFLFVTAVFLAPVFVSGAGIVNLGEIKDLYYGDKVSAKWNLSTLSKGAEVSVYFVNKGGSIEIQVSAIKGREDSIEFTILSTVPEQEYRIEVTEKNTPYKVIAATGWFKVNGNRNADIYNSRNNENFDYKFFGYFLDKEKEVKFDRLRINKKKNGDLDIDWKARKEAKVSLWATCSEDMYLYNPENDVQYICPDNTEEVNIHRFAKSKLGKITLQPRDVTKQVDATFKVYALDDEGLTVGKKERTVKVPANSRAKDVVIQQSNSKTEEILQLIKILKLDVDDGLVELLTKLGII